MSSFSELEAKAARLEKALRMSMATSAVIAAGGNPALLAPFIASRMRLKETPAGGFAAEIIDEDGGKMLSPVSGSSDPMQIGEFIATLKTDPEMIRAFDGNLPTGPATAKPVTKPAGPTPKAKDLARLNPVEQLAAVRRAGLPAQAAVGQEAAEHAANLAKHLAGEGVIAR